MAQTLNAVVGGNVKRIRQTQGLSLARAAARLDRTFGDWSKWRLRRIEEAEVEINIETLAMLVVGYADAGANLYDVLLPDERRQVTVGGKRIGNRKVMADVLFGLPPEVVTGHVAGKLRASLARDRRRQTAIAKRWGDPDLAERRDKALAVYEDDMRAAVKLPTTMEGDPALLAGQRFHAALIEIEHEATLRAEADLSTDIGDTDR
jgi:hypothetical protein